MREALTQPPGLQWNGAAAAAAASAHAACVATAGNRQVVAEVAAGVPSGSFVAALTTEHPPSPRYTGRRGVVAPVNHLVSPVPSHCPATSSSEAPVGAPYKPAVLAGAPANTAPLVVPHFTAAVSRGRLAAARASTTTPTVAYVPTMTPGRRQVPAPLSWTPNAALVSISGGEPASRSSSVTSAGSLPPTQRQQQQQQATGATHLVPSVVPAGRQSPGPQMRLWGALPHAELPGWASPRTAAPSSVRSRAGSIPLVVPSVGSPPVVPSGTPSTTASLFGLETPTAEGTLASQLVAASPQPSPRPSPRPSSRPSSRASPRPSPGSSPQVPPPHQRQWAAPPAAPPAHERRLRL